MADSLKQIKTDYIQRLHGGERINGKLHKGHNITASTASVPSKYQTIVVDNSEKTGFSSKCKRFNFEATIDDKPGPGTYGGISLDEHENPSYSIKGTAGFASLGHRMGKPMKPTGPAVGTYGHKAYLITRNDFSKAATTSSFHSPFAQNVEDKKFRTPAPNKYEVTNVVKALMKTNNVTANAGFKSKTNREPFDAGNNKNPAPWQYNINEDQVKKNVHVPLSIFKSKSSRVLEPILNLVPGPGSYRPFSPVEPVQKIVFPKKHYLCISAPAMPLRKPAPDPGPGTYELVDYEGPTKHYMSGPVFVSNTSRWTTTKPQNTNVPGPAHYRPITTGKQSFIYNTSGRWI